MTVPSLHNPAATVTTKDLASQILHYVLVETVVEAMAKTVDWRAHVAALPPRAQNEVLDHLDKMAGKIVRHFRLRADKGVTQ